ncbi:O-fucosyltransferase family protein [Euphorbia peplus]|nr:O-fucosyltransferase family protein [Euphorbia peplus]
MLLYIGTVSFDDVPIVKHKPAPGSIYRSPQLYLKLRPEIEADNDSVDAINLEQFLLCASSRSHIKNLVSKLNVEIQNLRSLFPVNLTVELLEDLLGTIQGAHHSPSRARAALKYIVLALSGHMDDILGKYKEVKHKILFLLEMLEPFLDPAIYAPRSTIAFGDVSFTFMENQEQTCVAALNIIRIAVQKPDVLSSLESEWRRGSVAPSVLLSILEPHMQQPPEIDLCKSPISKSFEHDVLTAPSYSYVRYSGTPSKSNSQDESEGKVDTPDNCAKATAKWVYG